MTTLYEGEEGKVKYLHKGYILIDRRQDFAFPIETPAGVVIAETRANTYEQAERTIEALKAEEGGMAIIENLARRAA